MRYSSLIRPDSLLRRLPVGLDDRQRMFIDGISVTLQMLDVAFERLKQGLAELSPARQDEMFYAPVLLDAWSMVDSANRLALLLRYMKNVKKTPQMRVFKKHLEAVEPLRNSIQHLNKDIQRTAADGAATWGTLSWVVVADRNNARAFVAVPGATVTRRGVVAPNVSERRSRSAST